MENGNSLLERDLQVLALNFNARLEALREHKEPGQPATFPVPGQGGDPYERFQAANRLSFEARCILLLALIPHIKPAFFDTLITRVFPEGGDLYVVGGVRGLRHRGMLPTGETAAFLLAGNDLRRKLGLLEYFSPDHSFSVEHILLLEPATDHEPRMSGRILLQPGYVDYFTTGKHSGPAFGSSFPARLLTTAMEWEDLVLDPHTVEQIASIKRWLDLNERLMEDAKLAKRIRPGYRALFYGPSGTGKTLTAALLGKNFGKEVYRIDLSQVVSKYIGETEKNLEKVFNQAVSHDWILFFDEADALFGKRTNVQSSHDRYANQEVAYLLQRVEDYPRLMILASNFKNNIDSAFTRRFNTVIHFPVPDPSERCRLWQNAIPENLQTDFDLKDLAVKYEMTGASIIQVIHYASLKALERNGRQLWLSDVTEGIRQEFHKQNKFF